MNKLVHILAIVGILFSCKDSKQKEFVRIDSDNHLDTLYLNEDMIGQFGFKLTYDSLTVNKQIPRNLWVDVSVKGEDTMVYVLKHANLFLTSRDSNFQIERISNQQFKFLINDSYHGYVRADEPIRGGYLEVYPVIQPHKGYILLTYWLDQPITYPEKTEVMMLYEPLEEAK